MSVSATGGCTVSANIRPSEEHEKIVKSLLWDSDLSHEDFYRVLKGKKEEAVFFTKEEVVKKALEYQNWYNVLKLLSLP
jgi:hypothetical protein